MELQSRFHPLFIVDDDPEQLADIAHASEEVGFREIVKANNAADAYAQIANREFRLAVVDVMLSRSEERKEGLDVIKRLREQVPSCRIIALTTRGRDQVGIEALQSGADDFVCAGWQYVNWKALLKHRLSLWSGLLLMEETDRCQQPKPLVALTDSLG